MTAFPHLEVGDLRKRGLIDEAYRRGYELLDQHPDDRQLKGAVGWVLYQRVKRAVGAARDGSADVLRSTGTVRKLLHDFARLGLKRPDLLFSLLVAQALRLPGEPWFLPRFLMWAGLDSFRREDYMRQTGTEGDTTYSSLVEKAAGSTAKAVCRDDRAGGELKRFALALVHRAMTEAEIDDPAWLRYRKATLLLDLGRMDEARRYLLPFVRQNSRQFWAWHALAKAEEPTDPDRALALCAMACLTCRQEEYSVGVLEYMARLANGSNHHGLAKWCVERAIKLRESRSWKIPESLDALRRGAWYGSAPDLPHADALLQSLSAAASEYLYEDCREKATFLGTFESRKGTRHFKAACRTRTGFEEVVAPTERFPGSEDAEVGEPITVGIVRTDDRVRIVHFEPRPDGNPFDCVKEMYGIVDHQNPQKGLVSIFLSATAFCSLRYRDFSEAQSWEAGTALRVLCMPVKDHYRGYAARPIPLRETTEVKRAGGAIRVLDRGFGFVEDVFVPPALAGQFAGGETVSVIAVRRPNRKTGHMGWAAVRVDAVEAED